jgi:SAM-dependent methyltransferase
VIATLEFTDEAARRLEIAYQSPDVRGQREEVLRRLALKAGEHVIDIGSGPGFLCEAMAGAVGSSGRVLGIDISPDLIALASKRNRWRWLAYQTGDAMALAAGDNSFDAAVHMQVLEYLPDPDCAISEMARVLKPGGRAIAVCTDWDAVVWHSDNPERIKRVQRAWEGHCTDPHLPRTLGARLQAAGLKLEAVGGYPIINTRLGDDTYSDGIMHLIEDFVRRQNSISAGELAEWAEEQRRLSAAGRYFFGTMRYLFLVTKSG